MSLDTAYDAVRDFHKAFGHPAPEAPQMQPLKKAETRAGWVKDECDELIEARTLEDQADAYFDQIYFALGGLVELGVRPQQLFEIVHRANMNKLHLIDGKLVAVYHPDGKIKKPEGWTPPEAELRAEIARQITEAVT